MLCRVVRRVIMVVRRRRQATGGSVRKFGSVGRDAGHLWVVGGVGRRLSWSRRRIVFGYWDEFAFASLPLVNTTVTRTSGIGGVALDFPVSAWPASKFASLPWASSGVGGAHSVYGIGDLGALLLGMRNGE